MHNINFGSTDNFAPPVPTGGPMFGRSGASAGTGGENIACVVRAEKGAYNDYSFGKNKDDTLYVPPRRVISTATKYKLFCAPTAVEELQRFCSLTKGRAQNTLCVQKDCMINHQGNCFETPVAPGEAFVLKDKDCAFTNPLLGMTVLEESLAESWMNSSHTMDE